MPASHSFQQFQIEIVLVRPLLELYAGDRCNKAPNAAAYMKFNNSKLVWQWASSSSQLYDVVKNFIQKTDDERFADLSIINSCLIACMGVVVGCHPFVTFRSTFSFTKLKIEGFVFLISVCRWLPLIPKFLTENNKKWKGRRKRNKHLTFLSSMYFLCFSCTSSRTEVVICRHKLTTMLTN